MIEVTATNTTIDGPCHVCQDPKPGVVYDVEPLFLVLCGSCARRLVVKLNLAIAGVI